MRREHPEVIFLAEAFTRPAMMTTLAKVGFAQSYTYFTWKNTRWELLEFLGQLLEWREFYRPNCFANTPDILHEYLAGRRPPGVRGASRARGDALARRTGSTPASSSFENVPVRPGSEEYLDSEKYEVKQRTLDGPLLPLVAQAERGAAREPGAAAARPLTFLETENEQLFAFLKRTGDNVVVDVVNLDPAATQEGVCILPVSTGLPPAYRVRDLLTDETWTWRIGRNYVQLGPGQSHVLRIGG